MGEVAAANTNAQILQFPKDRVVRSRVSEEMAQQKTKQQINYLDMVADEHIKQLFISFKMNGIEIGSTKESAQIFGAACEAIRASMYAIHGHKHVLYDQLMPVVEAIMAQNANQIENLYTLSDEIEENLEDEEEDPDDSH